MKTMRVFLFGWLAVGLVGLMIFPVYAQQEVAAGDAIAKQWDDFMHYTMIGNWELARGYGQAILDANPDPIVLLNLAESKRYADSYRNLTTLQADSPIREIADQILKRIEQGRFLERTDVKRIADEVQRLSTTTRGRMMAMERLKDSGEWSVPVMIAAIRDPQRNSELANIRWALPQLGRQAVNPLLVVLRECNELNIQLIVLDTLSQIGYPASLPGIKELLDSPQSSPELKTAALAAFRQIDRHEKNAALSAAELYEKLAEDYFNLLPSLSVPENQEFANVWFWNPDQGLFVEQVPRGAFDELMAMRNCEYSVALNPSRSSAVSLWLSSFFRLEAEGYAQPNYFGENHADASTYALTAGPEYLHQVLSRALADQNRAVALSAILVLERNSGQQSLLYQLGTRQPLIESLQFADRQVRFSAALAIGGALPRKPFQHSEMIVPILAEALQQKGEMHALLSDPDQERINRMSDQLRQAGGYKDIVGETNLAVAVQNSSRLPSVDLILLSDAISMPGIEQSLDLLKNDPRLAFCPVVVLSQPVNLEKTRSLQPKYSFMEAILENSTMEDILQAKQTILKRNQAKEFDQALADPYAVKASSVLLQNVLARDSVLLLKPAESVLLKAIYDSRPEIQNHSLQILARLDSMEAQRAIADFVLKSEIPLEIRLLALRELAWSAKEFGNLLSTEQIDGLYALITSGQADKQLRNLAAEAFGALNLPSARISQLIVDQAIGKDGGK